MGPLPVFELLLTSGTSMCLFGVRMFDVLGCARDEEGWLPGIGVRRCRHMSDDVTAVQRCCSQQVPWPCFLLRFSEQDFRHLQAVALSQVWRVHPGMLSGVCACTVCLI